MLGFFYLRRNSAPPPGISGSHGLARSAFRNIRLFRLFHCGAWKALLSEAMVTGYEVPGK